MTGLDGPFGLVPVLVLVVGFFEDDKTGGRRIAGAAEPAVVEVAFMPLVAGAVGCFPKVGLLFSLSLPAGDNGALWLVGGCETVSLAQVHVNHARDLNLQDEPLLA